MNRNSITATLPDSFSWKRVAAIAAYYSPYTGRQLICYLAVSLLFAILILLPSGEVAQLGLYTTIWACIPLLADFAPIMLAKWGDHRIVERLIPARASEKYIFYLIYFIIVIPASVYLLPLAACRLYMEIPAIQSPMLNEINAMQFTVAPLLRTLNILCASSAILTCLYAMIHCGTSRIIKGVLGVFAVKVAVGIMGAVYGIATVVKSGFIDCINANDKHQISAQSQQMMINAMTENTPYLATMLTILGIYVIVMLWLIYRDLKQRNL